MANQNATGEVTIIGRGMNIEGTLHVRGDARIGGKVVGQVKVDGKVITTLESLVEGEIVSATADIAHRVKGDITVTKHLLLRKTAVVDGDIQTPRLSVEDGAQLLGMCSVGRPPSKK